MAVKRVGHHWIRSPYLTVTHPQGACVMKMMKVAQTLLQAHRQNQIMRQRNLSYVVCERSVRELSLSQQTKFQKSIKPTFKTLMKSRKLIKRASQRQPTSVKRCKRVWLLAVNLNYLMMVLQQARVGKLIIRPRRRAVTRESTSIARSRSSAKPPCFQQTEISFMSAILTTMMTFWKTIKI